MTYASRSASFSGRTAAASIHKCLPVVRTQKRNARFSDCNLASSEPQRSVDDTRSQTQGMEAFEEMVVASRSKFLATANAILRNREDAEDAVQNAFLSGHRHLRSFEGRSAVKTWFTRIVLNAALMIQRKRKTCTIQPILENSNSRKANWTENIPASEPDPEMVHAERETFECINWILGKMNPVLRQAFTMTYYDELSGKEACAVLGVSSGTFKARLFRARRQVLDQTERILVAPMHKTTLSAFEFSKRK